jgi:hypothetical protein
MIQLIDADKHSSLTIIAAALKMGRGAEWSFEVPFSRGATAISRSLFVYPKMWG